MSELGEEEIIDTLKILIGISEFNRLNYKENKAIQGLLDLYKQEKEKNTILQNKIEAKEQVHEYDMKMIYDLKGEVVKLDKELQQEKEKNEKLEQDNLILAMENENSISKDKIKEKIEWLDKLELLEEVDYSRIKFATDILKKLLKEEQ